MKRRIVKGLSVWLVLSLALACFVVMPSGAMAEQPVEKAARKPVLSNYIDGRIYFAWGERAYPTFTCYVNFDGRGKTGKIYVEVYKGKKLLFKKGEKIGRTTGQFYPGDEVERMPLRKKGKPVVKPDIRYKVKIYMVTKAGRSNSIIDYITSDGSEIGSI